MKAGKEKRWEHVTGYWESKGKGFSNDDWEEIAKKYQDYQLVSVVRWCLDNGNACYRFFFTREVV